MLIEKADRCKGTIGLHNEDVLHVRCIAQSDALLCKTIIYFILYLIDHDDRVRRYSAFDLKKERGIDLFLRQAADQFRFLKEAILRGEPFQRGMRALVIASDIGQQAASELFERVKIPHIQGCHPLIFQGTEPSLDLAFIM